MSSENLEILLYKAVQIGIALTLCVPLVILAYFGVTPSDGSAKSIVFQMIVEITFLFYVCLCLVNRNYIPKRLALPATVALFLVVEIVASVLGINFFRSFFGSIWWGDGIVFQLHLLVFLIIITSVFKEKEEWIRLLKVSVVVSALSSLAAVIQKLGINRIYGTEVPGRVSGTLVSPGFFGNYIALSIFLTLFIALREKRKLMKILWYSLLALHSWALIFSKMKGAWAAVLAGFFILFVFEAVGIIKNRKLLSHPRKIVFVAVAFLLLVSVGIFSVFYYKDTNDFARRAYIIISFQLDDSRKAYWGNAVEALKDRPLLGWGNDSFAYIWQKYSSGSDFAHEISVDKPHNKFLEILVSSGILGLLTFGLVFAHLFHRIFSYRGENHFNDLSKNRLKAIFTAFLVCYLIGNFFLFDSVPSYILLFVVVGFVNNNFAKKTVVEATSIPAKLSFTKLAVVFSVVFPLAFIMYHLNINVALSGMYLHSTRDSSLPEEALFGYQNVFLLDTIYNTDMRLIAMERMQDIIDIDSEAPDNVKKTAFSLILTEKSEIYAAMNAPEQNKNSYYAVLTRTYRSMFLNSKDPKYLEEADYILPEAIQFNANNPTFYELLAEIRILQGKYLEGERFAKNFYESLPATPARERKMYYILAKSYYEAKDFERSFENIKKLLQLDYVIKKDNSDDKRLNNFSKLVDLVGVGYYNESGNLKEVKYVFEETMQIYPEYAPVLNQHLEEMKASNKK